MSIKFKTHGKVSNDLANTLLNNMLSAVRSSEQLQNVLKSAVEKLHNGRPVNGLHTPLYGEIYHYLRRAVEFDMSNDDNHPVYRGWMCDITHVKHEPRVRLAPFTGYSISKDYYGNGCNDDHWFTVQKQVKSQFENELIKILYPLK